ncbi:MAG: glycosyltransferase family 4 protein [Burkholderiales bacterium]
MKVVLTTLGKFHSFDLARQLHARGALEAIFSGYPRFKLKGEGLPDRFVRTFPYLHTPYMAAGWRDRFGLKFLRQWEYWDRTSIDRFVARSLPDAQVFVGLSSCGLATGREAKRRGMKYVCDRGSTHIRHQHELLRDEHARWGLAFAGVDPRIVEREEAEYAMADLITVPSTFVRDTFIARGLAPEKVKILSYGVDLDRFHPSGAPRDDGFDLLFVGGFNLRKGVPYLLSAFQALQHSRKTLTIAGVPERAAVDRMRELCLLTDDVKLLGHVPQPELKALMSRSHALVLPSLEEGLAMVMAQALACGCPVVASRNTGAEDLFTDRVEGFIVEPGDAKGLTGRLQALADDTALQQRMRAAAVLRVRAIGGWASYGENAMQLYEQALS